MRKLKKEQALADEDIKRERLKQSEASLKLKQNKEKAEKEKLEKLRHENATEQIYQNRKLREEQAFADQDKAERDRKATRDQHELLEKEKLSDQKVHTIMSKLHSPKPSHMF